METPRHILAPHDMSNRDIRCPKNIEVTETVEVISHPSRSCNLFLNFHAHIWNQQLRDPPRRRRPDPRRSPNTPVTRGKPAGSGAAAIVIEPLLIVSGIGAPLPLTKAVVKPPAVRVLATPLNSSGNVAELSPVVSI